MCASATKQLTSGKACVFCLFKGTSVDPSEEIDDYPIV